MTDQELIRQVAEKVMGWKLITIDDEDIPYWFEGKNPSVLKMGGYDFDPFTNANHWMMVVERMRELGWAVKLYCYASGTDFGCILTGDTDFTQDKDYSVCASDWGHAISLAALKALEEL